MYPHKIETKTNVTDDINNEMDDIQINLHHINGTFTKLKTITKKILKIMPEFSPSYSN